MGTNFHTAWTTNTIFKTTSMPPALASLDKGITYNKNIIIHCDGGNPTYNSTTGILTWASTLRVIFNREDGQAIQNTVVAGSITLADNQFAYLDLNETNGTVLTMQKATVTTGSASNFLAVNRLVMGYRNTTCDEFFPVYLGNILGPTIPPSGAGSGDVVGPSSAIDSNIAEFDGTTGKIIKDGLLTHANVASAISLKHAEVHATTHVNGTDDIQSATAAQKGLMSLAYAGKLDGIEAGADVTDATNVDAAGAVMNADYNAQTILAAISDDTPVALTVNEQTLVGRITGGNIASLTIAQIRTLLGYLDGNEQQITPADSVTINWNNGATAWLLLNRASTAITMSNPVNGKVYRIRLLQDGTGGRLVTWTDTIRWRGGSAPTLTTTLNKVDFITLVYSNSEWYADASLNF